MRTGRGHRLTAPFLAAPMAGITDAAYRVLAAEKGAAFAYSEMISAKGLVYGNPNTESLLHLREGEAPVAYQIFGRDPAFMKEAAIRLAPRGNVGLDINMGCPVPKIVKNGEGAALMREPKLAAEIIRAVIKGAEEGADSAPKPVTVKIRAGWDEDSINACEFALACEDAGCDAIAVHGRTRTMYYSGSADWDIIKKVKETVGIPVIASGDIITAQNALRAIEETGCDAVMIARGALGNPWIYEKAAALYFGEEEPPAPSESEIYETMRKHFHMLIEDKGEKRACFEMRKHGAWYMKGRPHATDFKRRINAITDADAMTELLSEH